MDQDKEMVVIPTQTDVSTLLHAACRRRDLTVCDVARLCDLTGEYMCDIVSGKRPPSAEAAERIVGLLHLDREETAILMRLTRDRDVADARFGAVHPSAVD